MPEEIEVPTEHLHESMKEAAEEGGLGNFGLQVALSSALFAVVAAIGAMFAGHAANEALILQIQSSDNWAYYQAKSIKAAVLESKVELLQALKKKVSDDDLKKQDEYKADMEKISQQAKDLADESAQEMHSHVVLARAVTFFQIAIALSAIAVLSRRRQLWILGVIMSLAGLLFFVVGLL